MAQNTRQANANNPKRRNTPTILLILSALLLIIAFIMMYPTFFSGAQKRALIRIPKDATPEMLHDTIAKYEGERYANTVMRLIKMRNTDLTKRNGAYRIQKGESPFRAMRRLTSGGQSPVRITINGNRDIYNIAERIAIKLQANTDSVYAALTDPAMLATHGMTPENAKALLFTDSYDVYWTDSPKQVVDKFANVYENRWNPQRRKKAEELGLTPVETMILCSIVDEETNNKEEKGQIARVYINRLGCGMKLQSDPTVRYALKDFTIRRVTGEHLKVDSPYNTYKYEGLPPGPLRTISTETLDLVLDSKPSFDLYMCASEDFSGSHNFADTYEEHLENARRYREALDARGIK